MIDEILWGLLGATILLWFVIPIILKLSDEGGMAVGSKLSDESDELPDLNAIVAGLVLLAVKRLKPGEDMEIGFREIWQERDLKLSDGRNTKLCFRGGTVYLGIPGKPKYRTIKFSKAWQEKIFDALEEIAMESRRLRLEDEKMSSDEAALELIEASVEAGIFPDEKTLSRREANHRRR